MRWPSASHQPASTNQMMLPISEPAPASGFFTSVRPNGQRQTARSAPTATPNGIVMIRMNITSAATA